MATPRTISPPVSRPGVSAPTDSESGDFVLFPDQNSIYEHYRNPNTFHNGLFQHPVSSASEVVSFTDILGSSELEDFQNQAHVFENMNRQFYMTSSQPLAGSMPTASSDSGFQSGYSSSFSSSDIPRSVGSYMDDAPMTTAPDVLVHPPTFSHFAQPFSHGGEYRSTPAASPATSVGGFDGSAGSGLSGSEAGSVTNSPYSAPVGVEEHFREGLAFNPAFVGALDPSILSNSSAEEQHPITAISSFASPAWPQVHSPPPSSVPSSPELRRGQINKLSPYLPSNRYVPYPARRDSNGSNRSAASRKSMGSPSGLAATLEFDDKFNVPGEIMGHPPSRSLSQSSRTSRGVRANTADSTHSGSGPGSSSGQSTKDTKDTICPECHKSFRDLRAHQLTHQLERPEKCPIATCEYSKKGFARKYDCQRHTLTHYKGTMVCGFCPGSGSATEKSFNRADVFKRHLMAVHNVEQTPPNGRKKPSKGSAGTMSDFAAPYATGKCSTCNNTFSTAQQFYEHLDECVLSKVVEEEPAALFNEHNLDQINPEEVEQALSNSPRNKRSSKGSDEEIEAEISEDEDEEMEDAEDANDGDFTTGSRSTKRSSRLPSTRSKSGKQEHSSSSSHLGGRGGVAKPPPRRRRKRKNLPAAWGAAPEQMITKRRCLMVFDGPKMLCRDEMMMSTELEVKAQLGGDHFVSDLDFWTMRRAEAFLESAPSRGGTAVPLNTGFGGAVLGEVR